MSDTDKLSAAFEDVEALSVNSSLLEYYTNMTEHHRTKISVIGGAYLVLTQLMLITPQETIIQSIKQNNLLFSGMLGLIMSLLFLGILHHAANIAIIATQRLNVLRNIYWAKLPKTQVNDGYQSWKTAFEVKNRDNISVSRFSMGFAILILSPIFLLTIARYHFLVVGLLTGNQQEIYLVLGAFYAGQLFLFAPFAAIIWKRTFNFYRVRDSYKLVQSSKTRDECLEKLKELFG